MAAAFRALLVWCLALAIPVQGIAAAAMQHCGAMHSQQQQQAAVALSDHHAGHAHAHRAHGLAADGHGHHGPAEPGVTGAHSDLQPNALGATDLAKSKCSACASCCSAVALLGVMPSVEVVRQHATRYPPLSSKFEPIVVAGPERPPRPFLA